MKVISSYVMDYAFWGCLAASMLLTIPAARKKSIGLMSVAAALSLTFGIAGAMTIGVFGLMLTCFQIALIFGYALKVRRLGWVLLFVASFIIWVSVWYYLGDPLWWMKSK